MTEWDLLLRFGTAILVGGLVGLERQLTGKPAGLRTHMLVSFGAAIFVITAIQLAPPEQQFQSVSRVMQGIVTGIGFLGAAEVLRMDPSPQPRDHPPPVRILGLTSAAAVWVSAGLGAAAGGGLWMTSLLGSGVTVLILSVIRLLEERFWGHHSDL